MMNHSKRHVIWRTLAVSLAAVLLTVTVLAASELFFGEIPRKTYPDGIPAPQGELRALTVRTQDNADFPSAPGLPAKILQDELDELATFAKTYGYNAIFLKLRRRATPSTAPPSCRRALSGPANRENSPSSTRSNTWSTSARKRIFRSTRSSIHFTLRPKFPPIPPPQRTRPGSRRAGSIPQKPACRNWSAKSPKS